jgi:tellurite resistance protein TehA-like permease
MVSNLVALSGAWAIRVSMESLFSMVFLYSFFKCESTFLQSPCEAFEYSPHESAHCYFALFVPSIPWSSVAIRIACRCIGAGNAAECIVAEL